MTVVQPQVDTLSDGPPAVAGSPCATKTSVWDQGHLRLHKQVFWWIFPYHAHAILCNRIFDSKTALETWVN